MSIKIFHLIPTLSLGGAERLVVDLCTHLSKDQFECKVITTVTGGPLEDELSKAGITVIKLDALIKKPSANKWVRWYQRSSALTKLLRKDTPDILHTHLTSADILGWRAGKKAHVKHIITTEHNINVDEKKWQTFLKKFLATTPERIVCLSEAIKNYAVQAYHFSTRKLSIIYDGVDTRVFVRGGEPESFEGRVPQITCVARLETQKGHEVMIRALASLKNKSWELTLVGEGSLKEYILELARVLEIRERVNYLGARKDIPAILQDTDIFVLPSLWEGLGIVVLEAMASSVPVIASNVGGIPEMVIDKETGLLVAPGNVEALSTAFSELLDNPALARTMGIAGRARVEENFTLEKTIESYSVFYTNLEDGFKANASRGTRKF